MRLWRFAAGLVAVVMACSLTACSETGAKYDENGNKILRVGMVTDTGGVNDGSFNQLSWEGLEKAGEEFGIEVGYLESATDADYMPNIEAFCDEGYDLVIATGYALESAIREAAVVYPDTQFAILETTVEDLPNVRGLMFEHEQASYLVGYVAGMMTETDTIGLIVGMNTETLNLFGYGYIAGALAANPDITVLQQNVNSFSDAATGKAMANTEITNGADIIFAAAGASGLGAIEACQEAGIYAIGVDSDQSSIAPDTIITSAMKRVDIAVYDTVEQLVDGTLDGGVATYDLAAGGVDIAPTQDLLPQEVIEAVDAVKSQILSGEVVVPSSQEEFEAMYGTDIYQLD